MRTQIYTENPAALRGFFSWLKKTINNVVSAVVEVSRDPFFILEIVHDAFDGGGFTFGIGNNNGSANLFRESGYFEQVVSLNEYEENMLDLWVEQRFLPFFKQYFLRLKQFSSQTPTISNFTDYYNSVHEFLGLIKWYRSYVLINGESGLTMNALKVRNQFLTFQINLLETELNSYIQEKSISVSSRLTSKTINTNEYIQLQLNIPNSLEIEVLQITQNTISDPGINIINEPTPKPSDNTSSTSGIIWMLVGFGAMYLLSNEKDKVNEEETVD
ncbi:hypothetical protein [Gaetbulibacter jejuensis]|uniref:Uncharacterized protein n=1 Tax=Gaetbulibacter jejuensis TaxID=584607 RepID=A0ABN1JZF6_9FLAO